jgi:S1-C subfamily serine protease
VPIAADEGVYVHPPRKESAAAHAGLCGGDRIVAADGHQVQSYAGFQTAVREHKTGETIQLKVRRRSGEIADMAVVRA